MVVSDILAIENADIVTREVYLHAFVDQLRRSGVEDRRHAISLAIKPTGSWAAVVAATVEYICEEVHDTPPEWTSVRSDDPVYIPAVPRNSQTEEVLCRISPSIFRKHNVFVSPKFMTRA